MTEPIKEDKRKLSSGKNLAKARQAKLDKLKVEKKAPEYQFESDSSSSDSEEEMIVVKPSKKTKVKQNKAKIDNTSQEIAELRGMLQQIIKKPKKKPKKVVQIINPQQEPKKPSPELEQLTKMMLMNFNK